MLPFPEGEVFIKSFKAEVVDSNNNSVPLDEVYNHHWLVFENNHPNKGVCGGYLSYRFGVGAESRGTPTIFPDNFGLVSGGNHWGANIHLLRTVGLSGGVAGVKDCIECAWAPNKGCSKAESGRSGAVTTLMAGMRTVPGRKPWFTWSL